MTRETDHGTENKAVVKKTAVRLPAKGFPVVGLGASAGGLEALEAFFKAMPDDSGAAFVVVTHLDPAHVSLMSELLQKYTAMPVTQVKDGVRVAPGHVYVIPPNRDLSILGGTLQLLEQVHPRGANLPIDHFFRALAQDQEGNAIGIILSGTGSDGSVGLKAIKAGLGMTMVQSEVSAKYDGMPHNAIATGAIDYILPPEEMPGQLISYISHSRQQTPVELVAREGKMSDALQKIFVILRARTNHDFSQYKMNTICRRIERRMNVHQLDDIHDYVRYLQESDKEAEILFNELLIGVTNFFRDPDAFEALGRALVEMLQHKPADYTVRVWVTGCSSGEEAYSVAILLIECMEQLKQHFSVQIFGTDIDDRAITTARAGLYPASILANLSEKRLRRYFIREDDGQYRIRKNVREMLVFAPQNLIKDPPFTKLDLLCCRNLLIYFGAELQQKLLPLFHYSLVDDGILFLGSSESIGQNTDSFIPVDKKWKIFRVVRSQLATRQSLVLPPQPSTRQEVAPVMSQSIQQLEETSAFQMVEAILQQSDAPPCVIINEACNILYVYGKTGRFLEPAEGRVSVNLLEMVRPGLKKELAEAIHKVAMHKQEVICKGLQVQHNGVRLVIDLLVKPILESTAMRGLIMVVFDEVPEQGKQLRAPRRAALKKQTKTVDELEQDLLHTRESLQTTIEELETSNEELKSTNEELQSTNEELQSTNEELETSKEELQSLNEESATVNLELQSRIDDLSDANDDMKNLLDSTDIATVFLDIGLCIRRFTPRVSDIIPLSVADAGRPLEHFSTSLLQVDLAQDAKQVLDDLMVRELEAASKDGKAFLIRLRPYRTLGNVIDGVVITFLDITERKQMEKSLRRQIRLAEGIVQTIAEPLLVLDDMLRVVTANPAFYAAFMVTSEQTEGEFVYELGNGQWDIPRLRELLEDVLPSQSSFDDFRVEHDFEEIGRRSMLINARLIAAEDAEEGLILLAITDVTAAANG
ncbi:chemotaxis protein CheB [Mariprofundus ferrooxydans]|uniref:chemotaxis protein CheB n=1 Tax=Mariprofundus ferrooxydans TaxID=314344 RepID=UPI0014312E32|nr:chemotaxis protein CheB [Mariprofundus ferrooxydans]